jgi:hypothetical protein
MLLDVLDGRVDAVVLVSNESDLKFPVSPAKNRVPVGLINQGKGYPALPGAPEGELAVTGGVHFPNRNTVLANFLMWSAGLPN